MLNKEPFARTWARTHANVLRSQKGKKTPDITRWYRSTITRCIPAKLGQPRRRRKKKEEHTETSCKHTKRPDADPYLPSPGRLPPCCERETHRQNRQEYIFSLSIDSIVLVTHLPPRNSPSFRGPKPSVDSSEKTAASFLTITSDKCTGWNTAGVTWPPTPFRQYAFYIPCTRVWRALSVCLRLITLRDRAYIR